MEWLKEKVKEDVIGFLVLCFILGSAFIWTAKQFNVSLSDGEKVNATVLWLTALAIFWYAYETYQLKKNTSDQVNVQEEIMLNEFLPILEPVSVTKKAFISEGDLQRFNVRNLGKGPAKYINIYVGREKFQLDMTISSGESETIKFPKDVSAGIIKMLDDGPDKIRMVIAYQDIYQRKFQTNNIYFDKLGKKPVYYLRSSSWDFKRLGK